MAVIDELKKISIINTDDSGNIKIIPLSKFEWQTNPISEDSNFIVITEDEYIGLKLKVYQFNDELNGIESFSTNVFRNFIQEKRRNAIKKREESKESSKEQNTDNQ